MPEEVDQQPFAPYWCEICQSHVPSSALIHKDADGVHGVTPIRPSGSTGSSPFSPATRKYSYRWFDPTKGIYSRPVIEVTAFYDPESHHPEMIHWQLQKVLQQMVASITLAQEGTGE